MVERIRDDDRSTRMVYVDDRSPSDFAGQLEGLVDAGDPTVYVPIHRLGDAPALSYAFVSRTAADQYTAAVEASTPTVDRADVVDPEGPIPDRRP